jgi:hypothetical protein
LLGSVKPVMLPRPYTSAPTPLSVAVRVFSTSTFPESFSSYVPWMVPLVFENTPPYANGKPAMSIPERVKAKLPPALLVAVCRSKLPLEVADPSNCVISA